MRGIKRQHQQKPEGGQAEPQQLPVAVEMSLTSCSKCHNCLAILYDEEIMAGWTPEDSNLNTRCPHCRKLLVPFLTVHLRDYRAHPPASVRQLFLVSSAPPSSSSASSSSTGGTGRMTPGVSQESVLSMDKEKPTENGKGDHRPSPLVSPAAFGPITVPYLSPLVLRRELENILEQEGDVCMTVPSFVDQHSILYWNMVRATRFFPFQRNF